MQKKILIVIILLIYLVNLQAQNKRDYKWVLGADYIPDLGIVNGNIIDFNNRGQIDTLNISDSVADHNAQISDKEGNLLFFYNGCRIVDSTFQRMENGDSINYGFIWDQYCFTYWSLYPHTQNGIILPDPGNDSNSNRNGYYVIHKRDVYQNEPYYLGIPELLYTYVDMNGNGGRGRVTIKNKRILKTTKLLSGYLTACKHANGKDWWMIQMEEDTNIYFKVLLTEDTIKVIDSVSMGPVFDAYSSVGEAVFTPDGTKWLMNNSRDHCMIYDFDRETGEFSNLRRVMPQDSGIFYGVAVSPNSRFAYLSNMWDLFQIDLWADDIPSSLTHIDHIDGFGKGGNVYTFNNAQLAPDCKIYIVPAQTNHHLHVINKPNEKGKACDFRQHSLYLPKVNLNGSIPNFPHFRIDEEDICDSTITWIPDEYIVKAPNALSVYPNPASVSATISVFSSRYEYGKIRVFDVNGEMIRSMDIDSDATLSLDVQGFTSGVYVVEYVSYLNGGRDLEKLVIME